ncbi:hypothetical protein J6W78_03260 [bacterium]|nr:hypothetical protein [bacterium]
MKKIILFAAFMLTATFSMPLFAAFTSTTVQGDVIVTDTETGLIWQKTYVSGKRGGRGFPISPLSAKSAFFCRCHGMTSL